MSVEKYGIHVPFDVVRGKPQLTGQQTAK